MNPLLHTDVSSDLAHGRPSAGQMLRAAREAQGLHLAVLSVNLKVSVRQLEALEADQHDNLKGAAFVRALAQSVCRQLKIDPTPVLAALPQASAPKALEPASLSSRQAAVQAAPRSASSGSGKSLSRQVLLLAMLMLVGAAALIWWPNPTKTSTEEAQDPAQAAVPMGQASDPEEALVAASADFPASAPAVVAASAPALQPAPVVPPLVAASAVPAVRPQASIPAVPASVPAAVRVAASSPALPAASAAAAVPAADASPLVLRVAADAWVEVRDSRGQMAVKRMVKAGETVKLDAVAPLFVYVGHADSAELSWQGKPVDLKPHTQNNEARLQLKP